jgi:hypothetical protein
MSIFSNLFGKKGNRAELDTILRELFQPTSPATMPVRKSSCPKRR